MASCTSLLLCLLLVALGSCNPQFNQQAGPPCGYSDSYDCVPYFQCIDGVINTDGEGLINLRIKPQATCVNPDYPDVPALCCLIPGKIAPLDSCNHNNECVEPYLCSANGHIITDGGGIIDIRAGQTTCWLSQNDVGVCCTPPTPIIDICPGTSYCANVGQCSGQALNALSNFIPYVQSGEWSQCALDFGNTGVCCDLPILDYCDLDSTCVAHGGCLGTALNAQNAYVPYNQQNVIWQECKYGLDNGVCCKQPLLDQCPGSYSVCIDQSTCLGTALNTVNNWVDYSTQSSFTWQQCSYGNNRGICCEQPVRVLDYCPRDAVCKYENECLTSALDEYNQFLPYSSTGNFQQCNLGGGARGICCAPKPIYLEVCPVSSECVDYGHCDGGLAMGLDGNFIPYDPIESWEKCNLGHGTVDAGVCCIAKKKIDPPPAADKCGIRNYKIDQRITSNPYEINEAAFGEFSWQTIIFFQNYTFKCGATLISNRHVLTAAHCVDKVFPYDIRLRFGEWQVNTFDEPLAYVDRNVAEIYIHPQFNPRNVHNDIAILELIDPLQLQYHINTACIPTYGQKFDAGYHCFASGWGKDNFEGSFQHILKKIELPYVDHHTCQNLLRKTRLGKHFRLDESFLCAGGEANKDACSGDGGGPLVCEDISTGQYVLAGITAWGIGCGTQDVPGVYADVGLFTNWIDEIVQKSIQAHTGNQQNQVVGYGK